MKKQFLILTPIIIALLGFCGFYIGEKHGIYQSVTETLNLLILELDPTPYNVAVEAARWLAVIFFGGLVFSAVAFFSDELMIAIRARSSEAVGIHGDSPYADILDSSLGRRGIASDSRSAFNAPRQVLMFKHDIDALEFYEKNKERFSNTKETVICLSETDSSSEEREGLHVINIPEIKAISYWSHHYLTESTKVAIVGDGLLAEKILYWGLLVNIYDLNNDIKYMLIGNHSDFKQMHEGLSEDMSAYGGDEIEFPEGTMFDNLDALKTADLVILCDNDDINLKNVSALKQMALNTKIHVLNEGAGAGLLDNNSVENISCIDDNNIEEVVLMDGVHTAGKKCHATYDVLVGNAGVSDHSAASVDSYVKSDSFANAWKCLDSFSRLSNYALAIHDVQKMLLLGKCGIELNGMSVEDNENAYDNLPQDTRRKLEEIEHIRWSRFHFLNFWKAPTKEQIDSGDVKLPKDKIRRLHTDLIPFDELSEEDQNKDSFFYRNIVLRI